MTSRSETATTELSDDLFQAHALDILKRELGEAGVVRFLRLRQAGTGDFTHDRRKWQKGLTVRQIADRISKEPTASA